ncbi:protein TIC 22-like, chloroplastic isoform X1 [Momordica charantia]|uniref:Protein TIC 22-like, chloroplastic isoform X1 n=1 Tax=Momordica charantia TaxID=3673 RepID=A0A6J1D9F7_MOMCH|nr:protein TIC 22-like, chloroplastic isoform X1 [Momordica charantia]
MLAQSDSLSHLRRNRSSIFCNSPFFPLDEMSFHGNDPNSSFERNLRQALYSLQNHCSGLLHTLSHLPPFNPPLPFKTHLQNQPKRALDSAISPSDPAAKNPLWARVAESATTQFSPSARPAAAAALSTEAIEERLAGIPVYALSNSAEEFVLVSGASTAKSLGLFCFKKEDAEALLQHVGMMDASAQNGSKVVPVALNKVFQLHVNGVTFRLVPECSQVKNALSERKKAGISADGFSGVPVFQSKSLILRSQNKSYRPAFFRKEDLEKSLQRASREQNQVNPAFRPGDIQVAGFEEVIKGMKDNSISTWDDVVFIPPGFDVSTDPKKQQQ